ncbi:hypothetical protein J6590_045383 [Homalodisca vitripennis]|nr:hypothetical protein J6590_045383 [Homalodisca vitripennis]
MNADFTYGAGNFLWNQKRPFCVPKMCLEPFLPFLKSLAPQDGKQCVETRLLYLLYSGSRSHCIYSVPNCNNKMSLKLCQRVSFSVDSLTKGEYNDGHRNDQ